MKKSYLIPLAAAALTSVGLIAATQHERWLPAKAAAQDTQVKAPSAQDDDYLVIYGNVQLSQNPSWNEVQKYGVYKFDNTSEYKLTAAGPISQYKCKGGGFFLDGYYYFVQTPDANTQTNVNNTFIKMDVDTWKMVNATGHSSPTKTTSVDMTYDYTTNTAYAICTQANSSNPYWLRTVNLSNGEMTDVAPVAMGFSSIACDGEGQLWGFCKDPVNYPRMAMLYKIDKTTGACEKVGDLGYNQRSSMSGACFDLRTGKLYYSTQTHRIINEYNEEDYHSYLFEVDTKTGKATPIKDLIYYEELSTMFMIDCAAKGPEAVADLDFKYEDGNLSGYATCTLPTRSFNRQPLSGNLKVEVMLDGKVVQTATGLKPGDSFQSDVLNFKTKGHVVKVVCYAATGEKGLNSKLDIWGGVDTPAKVTGITVTPNKRGDTVEVAWEPVTKGQGNGAIDLSTLTYKVVRRPDMKVVAEGLTEPKYTDHITDRYMMLSQYEVYAVLPAGESAVAYSPTVLCGAAYETPYFETFDTQRGFNTFTVIDAAGCGTVDGNIWLWYPQYREAVYWRNYDDYYQNANSWMVTPTIELNPDKCYRFVFQIHGYTYPLKAGDYPVKFNVWVGDDATVDALNRKIYETEFSCNSEVNRYINTVFVPKDGDCRIGIQLLKDGTSGDHVALDNVRVMEAGSAYVPGTPEIVSYRNDDGIIKCTVKAPTTNAKGQPITSLKSIAFYRNGTKVTEIANPTPGQSIDFVDENPLYSDNDYTISAVNDEGSGLEAAFTISARPDAPKPVVDVKAATRDDGRDALITWAYPEDMLGAEGNKLREDHLSYNIYRVIGTKATKIAEEVKGNSYTDVDISKHLDGARQAYITYQVEAVTDGGTAAKVEAKNLFGRAYELPVDYGFGDASIDPWVSIFLTTYGGFSMAQSGYDPRIDSMTDGGVLNFNTSGSGVSAAYRKSPRFNLSSLLNPKFTFRLWHDASYEGYDKSKVRIAIATENDGIEQEPVLLPDVFVPTEGNGWIDHEVDLADFADCTRASILIYCEVPTRKVSLHIDRIGLTGDKPEYDARVLSVAGPTSAIMGRENIYTVKAYNNGTKDLDKVTVTLKKGDNVLGTQEISLNSEESKNVEFTYTPALDAEEHDDILTGSVETAGDLNKLNDSDILRISVVAPNLPYITDLHAANDNGHVLLTWGDATKYPGAAPVMDDLESYENFTIEDFGGWKMYDVDGQKTLKGITNGSTTYTWDNVSEPQAYIIFNPASAGVSSLTTARSGSRCLACFAAEGPGNEDWLVSPALYDQGQTISFYAKDILVQSLEDYETYDLMVSYSGTDMADFVPLKEDIRVASMTWTKQSFELPVGVRHFAIVCKSKNQFALLLDDFEYIPAQPSVELTGFNVYRDGSKLETVGENEYHDYAADPKTTYRYHVTAQYTEGESIFSNHAEINLSGVEGVAADTTVHIYGTIGKIHVLGAAGAEIAIYDFAGRCHYAFKAVADQESVNVAPGMYVVRVGGQSAKVLVK